MKNLKKMITFKPYFTTMKKLLFIITFLFGLMCFSEEATATHSAGGEIYYEYLGGNQYKVTFRLFRDCSLSPATAQAPGTMPLCYGNNCGTPMSTITMPKISVDTPFTGCPGIATKCASTTSTIPGYETHTYQVTVTLSQLCNNWKFICTLSARNAQTWLLNANSMDLYVEATLDNTVANPDNSPRFTALPSPYACINQQFNGSLFPVDIDGDSLFFYTVQPRDPNGNCATYTTTNIAYTGFPAPQVGNPVTNPIPTNNTFQINSQTGGYSFTPTNVGTGTMTFVCESYRNGQLIGKVMRDVQIAVLGTCPILPQPGQIDSNSVVGLYVDSTSVTACLNDSIAFCGWITSVDPDAILHAIDNHLITIPNSNITYSGNGTDSIQFCFTWQTTILDTGLHVITFSYSDSACKPPGIVLPQISDLEIFVNYSTQAMGDTILCAGDSTQISVGGGGPFTWTVLPGGSPISSMSCTNCASPWVKPTIPTYYVVEGCTIDTVFVDVTSIPSITVTPASTTCVNANFQLNASAGPGTQTYTYAWTPTTYLNNPNISNPIVQLPQNNITYTVTAIPNGMNACANTATVDISVLQGFNLDTYDSTLCENEVTAITGTGSNQYSYAWSPAAMAAPNNAIGTTLSPVPPGGVFTITASFTGCPDSSISIPVYMDPNPIVFAGLDREMCLGDSVHLLASVQPDTSAYSIQWVPAADLDNPNVANPVFDGKQNTQLSVTYTSPLGCTGTDDMSVTVFDGDFLYINGDRTLCPGDTTTINVVGGVSYYWYPNYYIDNVGNVNVVTVFPPVTTPYFVVGTDVNGCHDTVKAIVKIESGSVLDAGEDITIYPGEQAQLMANGNCSIFSWFPPYALSSTTIKNPLAQPAVTTKYVVTGQTEHGCPTIDSVTVKVSAESIMDLPNAFSPGSGTSLNDKLKITKRGDFTLNRFEIFNRWGNKVFSTTDINDGWDGRMNDVPQPLGVYVYVIEATSSTGKKFTKQGNVTLIR